MLIYQVGQCLINCLLADGRILVCTDGPSYANGMHFESLLLHRHGVERPPLPVLRLGQTSAILQGLDTTQVSQNYVRELQALGHAQDVLVLLGAAQTSVVLTYALKAAKEKGMRVVYIGSLDADFPLETHDPHIQIPAADLIQTLALQLLVLHGVSEVVDQGLFAS